MTLLLALILLARMDGAVVGPNPTCEWDQGVEYPNDIANYSWKYHLDGAGLGLQFSNVTCNLVSTQPNINNYTCSAKLPVNITGQHSIYIITTNTVGAESADSPASPTTPFYITVGGLEAPNSILIIKKEK